MPCGVMLVHRVFARYRRGRVIQQSVPNGGTAFGCHSKLISRMRMILNITIVSVKKNGAERGALRPVGCPLDRRELTCRCQAFNKGVDI